MDNKLLKKIIKHMLDYHRNNNGKLPSFNNIARKFSIQRRQARDIYRQLVEKGFLKRNYSQYKMTNAKKVKEEIVKQKKKDIVVIIIRLIMAIVGTGAICLSIYYTGIWLDEFLPFFLAYLLSCIMIAFSVLAFETIIIFWGNKQYAIISLFIILWFVVLLFSMISTIAGQYNQRIENVIVETEQNVETIHKKLSYEIYNQEEKDIIDSIKRKEKELNTFQTVIDNFDDITKLEDDEYNKWLYWDSYEKIKNINNEINKLGDDLKNVREIKKQFLEKEIIAGTIEETKIERKSFYNWIGSLFNVESRYIEFWMSIMPALFIDLIAPLAIAVSMFLKRKENE